MSPGELDRRVRRPAVVAFALAAAAYAIAAVCRVAWTWDGSFLFFRLLQDRAPVIPHDRLTHVPLMDMFLWVAARVDDLDVLAAAYGAAYSLLPLASLAIGLALLRGRLAPLRIWIVVGVLFVPLPGVMCPVMEVGTALQLFWPLCAFGWAGAPPRWLPAIAVLAAALFFLHPVAAILFAMLAAATGLAGDRAVRTRALALGWAVLAVVRLWLTLRGLDSYETAQFSWDIVGEELMTSLLLSPTALVVIAGAWSLAITCRPRDGGWGRVLRAASSRWSWLAILALGVFFFHDSRLWSGAFNYRKFAVIALAPFVVIATIDRRRLAAGAPLGERRGLVVPAAVFAALIALGSWSWQRELTDLAALGRRHQRVVAVPEVRGLEGTPLNHWAGTVVSLMVQGRRPTWVLSSAGVRVGDTGIELWPGEVAITFERPAPGQTFDLSQLRRASPDRDTGQ